MTEDERENIKSNLTNELATWLLRQKKYYALSWRDLKEIVEEALENAE